MAFLRRNSKLLFSKVNKFKKRFHMGGEDFPLIKILQTSSTSKPICEHFRGN